MKWIDLPPRGHRFDSPTNILRSAVVLLFVMRIFVWVPMAAFIHNLATRQPDAAHSFPVYEHSATFFLDPVLGRLHVNRPWIWLATLGGSVLIAVSRSKFQERAG